jgi:hypothetical protein
MIVFQLIAVPIVLLLFLRSIYRLVKGHRPRWGPLLGAAIWLAAAVAIIRPELSNEVAGLLGIGRGADLVIYIVAISFVASFLYFYQKNRKLESEITEIVRTLAIRRALDERGGDSDSGNDPRG